jgi:hypothetical protein
MTFQGSLPFEPHIFSFSVERQYHTLKHFSEIDDAYLLSLLERGTWSKKDIEKRMEKFGSKFDPGFAFNPQEILKVLKKRSGYTLEYRSKSEKRMEFKVLFDKSEVGFPVGWDTLVRIEDLDSAYEIESSLRSDFLIQYAKGNPIPTFEMNMIFEYSEDSFHLITLFPGKYAPPFPNAEMQTKDKYEEYTDFWGKHLFLVP